MTSTPPPINLDKLRHVVQKFGAHAFTTQELARDYHDALPCADSPVHELDATLHQHATVLGIRAQHSATGDERTGTVWMAI